MRSPNPSSWVSSPGVPGIRIWPTFYPGAFRSRNRIRPTPRSYRGWPGYQASFTIIIARLLTPPGRLNGIPARRESPTGETRLTTGDKANTVELTVRQWQAVVYFALSPCGRGVAPVSPTLRRRRLVVPSPPHPNPLPRGEREPEAPSAQWLTANSTVLALGLAFGQLLRPYPRLKY